MQYCKNCVEPNTRPDSSFSDDGICLSCLTASKMDEIDWDSRKKKLEKIALWGKTHSKSGYDCIVAVSGGKDSIRQSLYVRDEVGLKPLLVSCTYPPEQQTERGAYNLSNLTSLGFDLISVSPAPQTWKKLMRRGFLEFSNWCKSTELALYATTPKVAIAYNIPLVFYGENPALAWGISGSSLDEDANGLKDSNTLQKGAFKHLLVDGISKKDIFWYIYPSDFDMERAKLRLVYLGYFIKDFNDYENGRIAIENGMKVREGSDALLEDIGQINTFDALDDDFVHVNQMVKFFKFGFGKVTEQVSTAIRNNLLKRDDGIKLVKKYDGKCADRFIQKFCDYIGITIEEYWKVAESYRNKDIFCKSDNGEWKLRMNLE